MKHEFTGRLKNNAEAVYRNRRKRDKIFGIKGLFEEAPYDILLDLYIAYVACRPVSVTSACIAASVAPSTALRWISKLETLGLIRRVPDPNDLRRSYLYLEPTTLAMMEQHLELM